MPVVVCEVTDARRVSLGRLQGAREELYRRAAAVVAPDPVIAEWFCGARRTRMCDSQSHSSRRPSDKHRSENDTTPAVVTLSRLSSEKRPELLVRSFASIAHGYPDWDLEIYGLGPQRNYSRAPRREIGAATGFTICGFTNDPYDVLAAPISLSLRRGLKVLETRFGKRWRAAFRSSRWTLDHPFVRSCAHGIDGMIVSGTRWPRWPSALAELMSD